jgi:pSer/pThr/pTyr-binding forkhead associated (FHA) protein
MKAELVPENGDPPIPITRDMTVIGRREYCDVQIDDPSLSKRHCVVIRTDGLLVIRDLATTNGTKVKGQRIRWAALLPDDRITLGGYKLRVYLGPDDQPSPSERPGRAAQPRRAGATAKAGPSPGAGRAVPRSAFPTPSPVDLPVVPPSDDLEILDEESDDSGWRRLLADRVSDGDDLIELE